MISSKKLIALYNKAVESNHPDPDRAVFGRAELNGRNSEFSRDGKAGLFGVSESKARKIGREELDFPDENFAASIELDAEGFGRSEGDLNEMYSYTAGITGGAAKKEAYMRKLDSAFSDIQKQLIYEEGKVVDIKGFEKDEEDVTILSADNQQELNEEAKRASAGLEGATRAKSLLGDFDPTEEINRSLELLKEYVHKSV